MNRKSNKVKKPAFIPEVLSKVQNPFYAKPEGGEERENKYHHKLVRKNNAESSVLSNARNAEADS